MSEETNSVQKSTSSHPDLDWSQVKETVSMLKLAAAQVDYSMRDGNRSVDTLTESFMAMAESMSVIEQASKELWQKHDIDDDLTGKITEQSGTVSTKMQQAIVAFQFYDKLVQRLDHVVNSLSQLGDLVGDPSKLYSPVEWRSLQEAIRSKYTMGQERDLFDALMAGEDIESVLKRLSEMTDQAPEEDDIELF
jgi:hypothetical protein